ncbi:hypothetical protein NP493_153g05007 [Ridgeia piscesae]|uniref:C2 domain-containing protein n=1 Tax=Ridgeia piscesae TaxID=27915 RepID=A0AAD9P4F1_RIDPI|nr:hypothetical protein NP493_153g05007 [Ridgeia piscesae]
MLSFIVYDWDGRDASQDDFLGSAYVILSQEEPCVLRKSLPLGYNLFHSEPGEDTNKLGSINISVIHRPVPLRWPNQGLFVGNCEVVGQGVQTAKTRNFITSARQKLSSSGVSRSERVSFGKSRSECVSFGMSRSERVSFGKSRSERVSSGKSRSERVSFGKSRSERVSFGKSRSERVSFGKSRSERVSFGKSRSERLSFGKSRSERVSFGKSRSERVSFGKSRSECVSFAKSRSERVSFGKSRCERVSFGKSRCECVSIAKSRSERVSFGMSRSERVSFGKSRSERVSIGKSRSECMSFDQDLLEVHIMQAKNLMAMDSNGYSDPYLVVFVNKERRFTTKIKKKTLNPVWDEWVTMQLPKPNEQLEISVWDRDVFFQKDFLGCLTFSLDDIRAYSKQNDVRTPRIFSQARFLRFPVVISATFPRRVLPSVDSKCVFQHQGWFQLQRVQSGYVQLHFKVLSDYLATEESKPTTSSLWDTDSGGRENNTKQSPLTADIETQPSLRRASSENNMDSLVMDTKHCARERPCSTPVRSSRHGQDKKRERGYSVDSPAPLSPVHYHNVHGCLQRLKGLRGVTGNVYCKLRLDNWFSGPATGQVSSNGGHQPQLVQWPRDWTSKFQGGSPTTVGSVAPRLDNRSVQLRERKTAPGRLLIKSLNVPATHNTKFNMDFEIDSGLGVLKEALLIIDMKLSHKEHLATKCYTLKELFDGSHEVIKWIPLEKGIEVELQLSRSISAASGDCPQKHGNHSLLSSLKRTFSSKHKTT